MNKRILNENLIAAVKAGNFNSVIYYFNRGLFKRKPDVNASTSNSYTALMLATEKGYSDIVNFLIEKGADINIKRFGETALDMAIDKTQLEIAKLLINKGAGIGVDETTLLKSINKNQIEIAMLLVEKRAHLNSKAYNTLKNENISVDDFPLKAALLNGYIELAKVLIKRGADVNCSDKNGETPLHFVLRGIFTEIVEGKKQKLEKNGKLSEREKEKAIDRVFEISELLIKNGAKVNAKNKYGETPIMFAVRTGYFKVVNFLIINGADVNSRTKYGTTPLMIADNVEIVKLLINYGADYTIKNNEGDTVLIEAVDNRNFDKVKLIVELGADLNEKSKSYRLSATMAALRNGQMDIVSYLIDKGAIIDVKDINDSYLLLTAAEKGYLDIVKFLVEIGVDINVKNKDGNALLIALEGKHSDIAVFLIESGSEINIVNWFGTTPAIEAASKGQFDILKLLIEKGADISKIDNGSSKILSNVANNKIAKFLLDLGAKFDPKSDTGFHLLKCAIADKDYSTVKSYIEIGVKLDKVIKSTTETDQWGDITTNYSICDYANEFGNAEITKLLENAIGHR